MKVAVFGDSWAKELGTENKLNTSPAWWSILSNTYDLTNFGLSGSSTYYSYEKFEEVHNQFDKVIFIASTPGRIHLPNELKLTSMHIGGTKRFQVTSLSDAENTLSFLQQRDPSATTDISKLQAIVTYYSTVMNIKEQELINNMYQRMVKYIRGNDALVIDSLPVLYPISKFETNHWGIDLPTIFQQGFREHRKCHMSEENNVMLASEINTWLTTGEFNLTTEKFVIPRDDWTRYFVVDSYLQPNAS
jgi:hypothetical protein